MSRQELCPACLGAFQITARGAMRRHGFSAHFPHGRNGGGWHSGPCVGSGVLYLGTIQGNRFAVKLAGDYRVRARYLASLPPFTTQEATDDMVRACRDRLRRQRAKVEAGDYQKPEDFANTYLRGSFDAKVIEKHRQWMDNERTRHIEGLREHANKLTEAVSAIRSQEDKR